MPGSGGNSLVPLMMNFLLADNHHLFPLAFLLLIVHVCFIFCSLSSFLPGSSLCTVPPFFLHLLSWWCCWPRLHCLSCVVALPTPATPWFLHGWASLRPTAGSAEGRGFLEGSLEPTAPAPLPLQLMWVAGRFACVVLSREEKCSQLQWLRYWRSIWLFKSVSNGLRNSD